MSIIPTKFQVHMTTHCRFIAFLSVDTSRDIVTLTFDLLTLMNSCPAWRVTWPTNPATKSEDPTTIRSWVTSYNGSHWLPLKMRTRPLRMRRITWTVNRGSKTITFLESPTPILPIHYTTFVVLRRRYRFYKQTLFEPNLTSVVSLVDPENHATEPKIMTLSYIQPELWRFKDFAIEFFRIFPKIQLNMKFHFYNPQKALPCAEPRHLSL